MPRQRVGTSWHSIPFQERSKPSDWGIGLTVCAAAVCDSGRTILSISDTMMSVGTLTVDPGLLKARWLGGWTVMFSGNDITPAEPILDDAADVLAPLGSAPKTSRQVAAALTKGYRNQRRALADDLLAPFGLDVPTLLHDWRARMARTELRYFLRQIQGIDVGCDFLVFGFEPNGAARLFTIASPRGLAAFGYVGYWAIGSGASYAIDSLVHRGYNPNERPARCIYQVCEAKFEAEADPNVGHETFLGVLRRELDGALRCALVSGPKIDLIIREAWEQEGKPDTLSRLDARTNELIPSLGPCPSS